MKVLKREREKRLSERLQILKSRNGKKYFISNLNYPSQQRDKDAAQIKQHLKSIEALLPEIGVWLKVYRKTIQNILEQTKHLAFYLLVCKTLNNLKAITLLAKEGYSYEIAEISRSAVESLDLAFLFLEDEGGFLLKKWFKGEIISNEKSRELFHRVLNRHEGNRLDLPIRDIKGGIYDTYSSYTHSSYIALIDLIDVFYEDFDYKKYAGYHYTSKSLHLIDNVAYGIILNLKNAFIKSGDIPSVLKLDDLLVRVGYKNLTFDSITEVFRPYLQDKE